MMRIAAALTLAMAAGFATAAVTLSEKLPISTRIEVKQGQSWRRAVVSEDDGPKSATIKVRLDPDGAFVIAPRKSIRIVPAPAEIHVGDHVEWYDSSTFAWVTATVKEVGTGANAGAYRMVSDKYPKSTGMYSKAENIRVLAEPAQAGKEDASAGTPALGKYRCFAYGAPGAPPIFLGAIELAKGSYTATAGKGGGYSYDSGSKTITWAGGWMKDNNFGGRVESNALFRIARTSICSHQ